MRFRTYLVGATLFISACGGAAQKPEAKTAGALATSPEQTLAEESVKGDAKPDPTEDPKQALLLADRLSMEQLAGPERDGRFVVDRQVGALRKSIELYGLFIDRAGSDPRFQDEVRRSRERVEEAQTTITFLLSQTTAP